MTEALSRDFRERERERESIQNHRYMQAYESSRCVFVLCVSIACPVFCEIGRLFAPGRV